MVDCTGRPNGLRISGRSLKGPQAGLSAHEWSAYVVNQADAGGHFSRMDTKSWVTEQDGED